MAKAYPLAQVHGPARQGGGAIERGENEKKRTLHRARPITRLTKKPVRQAMLVAGIPTKIWLGVPVFVNRVADVMRWRILASMLVTH